MTKGWLKRVGPYEVERIACPDYAGDVDTSAPPKGVLHTTEGSWDGALSVFRQHYAPHFLVGPGRVAELLPLGRAAAALEHPSGTPATNGVCRVQIEIVGHSSHTEWKPDIKTLDALAWLMAELERVAGVPLHRVEPLRDRALFAKASGWMGHCDVPDNSHWDPGNLEWNVVLERARAKRAGAELRERKGFYAWMAWRLGEGAWNAYGPRNPRVRPNVPARITPAWWKRAAAFLARRKT